MTVYVDEPVHPYGRMVMCHMASPDLAELHAMADAIGVARRWFQDPLRMPKVSRPHYDIAKSKRSLALAAGAVAIDRYQMVVVSRVAMHAHLVAASNPGADHFADPFAALRGRDGRPPHPRFNELLAWWEGQQEGST